MYLLLIATVLALNARLITAADNSTPIVDLGYAQYQGSYSSTTNVSYFLGVRYAQPPTGLCEIPKAPHLTFIVYNLTGNLRWREPQTPTTSSDVQQATDQPNQCHQAEQGIASTNPYRSSSSLERRAVSQDEDCLFLKYACSQ